MPLLIWKPEYSVNDAEIDRHHQRIVGIFNKVYENVMNSPEVDSVIPIIDELLVLVRYHLSAEEQQMKENMFHDIKTHIAKHREFTSKIESLKTQDHGNNLEVTQELIIVLGNWLLRHVLTEDMKYSELSNGIGE
jgi:hemerythrin